MASLTLVAVALATLGAQPKLLDFYSEHCGPCRQMQPALAELESRGHSVEKIDVDRQPDLAARFRVESIPCLVVVVGDREVDRVLGVTPVDRLEGMLRQAAKVPAPASPAATAPSRTAAAVAPSIGTPSGQARAPIAAASETPRGPLRGAMANIPPAGRVRGGRTPSTRGRQPLGGTGTPRLSQSEQIRPQAEPNEALEALNASNLPSAPTARTAAPPANPLQMPGIQSEQPLGVAPADFAAAPASMAPAAAGNDWRPSGPAHPQAMPAANGGAVTDRLLAASVRLKIDDERGHSFGSGTIVDVRGEDALILTCGHVFRDSHGKGRVTIDMFGPGAPQGLEGDVISYDLESDVGLISFRPGVPVTMARIAPQTIRVQPGDPVFNAGCNNGDPVTLRSSRVTTIDKYLAPPNLQVAGQPVQGRSGGGLFNAQGEVIGVCNAADPADNEGLYAALPSIYKLLDTAGLASVYQPGAESLASAGGASNPLANVRPPHMPEQMPLATNPVAATETSAPQGLTPAEQQVLQQADQAEVVCIIRPAGNPQGKSQVVVIDRASPEFLRMLAQEPSRPRQQPAQSGNGPFSPAAAGPSSVMQAQHLEPQGMLR